MKDLTSVCIAVLLMAVAAEGSEGKRKVLVSEFQGHVLIRYDVSVGENVFTAKLRGSAGDAAPANGNIFSKEAEKLGVQFMVRIELPGAKDERWHVLWGSGYKDTSFRLAGFSALPKDNEKRVPIVSVEMPLKIEGVQVYLVPYRVVGEQTEALLIVISKDKNKIKNLVRLDPDRSFDWEKPFRPFLMPPDARDSRKTDTR